MNHSKQPLVMGRFPLNNTTVDEETGSVIIDHKCSVCGASMDDGITRVFNIAKPKEPLFRIKFRDLICRSCHTTSVAVLGHLGKDLVDA